uniref:Peptidase S1 domain-containing protein n=1 Tax=Anopheles dirus TaxID=7168 RepID=A0A182MYA2_9DIPT
ILSGNSVCEAANERLQALDATLELHFYRVYQSPCISAARMVSRSVLLVVLSCLCLGGSEALHNLFPIEIGLMDEDPFLPNEREVFDDCHIRYMRYGRDELDIQEPFPPYETPPEFTHIAAVGWTRSGGKIDWACMGVLIWNDFVLTSAHCTAGEGNTAPDVVRLGSDSNNASYIQDRKIKEVIRHPEYSSRNGEHDIALLQLDARINVNAAVVPTCLWLWDDVPFSKLSSVKRNKAGRGETDSFFSNEEMTRVNVKSADCVSPTSRNAGLPNGQLCMGSEAPQPRDCEETPRGNPLQARLMHNYNTSPFLVGILSSSFSRGTCNPVQGYTPIGPYRDWLVQVLLERNTTVTLQDFHPVVCAHRFARFRPRVDELMLERNGEMSTTVGNVDYVRWTQLNYVVEIEWPPEAGSAARNNCAGTFIDQQTVVTLAECAFPTPEGFQPIAVVRRVIFTSTPIAIKSIHVHPGYRKNSQKNNIAVLKLESRQNVAPACIWLDDELPEERFDLTGVGSNDLNNVVGNRGYDADRVTKTVVQHAMDLYPWAQCRNELSDLAGPNGTREGFSDQEHMCFRSDQWVVPGVCHNLPGAPVIRYINRAGVYLKYVFGMIVASPTCGYGIPAITIRLAPHADWLQSIIMEKRPSAGSESVIVINPDLKRSDECSNGDGTIGICVPHELCLSTKERLRKGERVTVCSEGSIVCCPWGDIARNSGDDSIRAVLDNCEDRYRSIRQERYARASQNRSLYTNFPHTAEIGWPQSNGRIAFSCLGYLITTNVVVMSARCTEQYAFQPTVARIGSLSSADTNNYVLQPIRRVRVHEDYDSVTGVNNIALVVLTSPILPTTFYYPGCVFRNSSHFPTRLFGLSSTRDTASITKMTPFYQSDCVEHLKDPLAPGQSCMTRSTPEAVFGRGKCLDTGDLIVWDHRTDELIYEAEYLVALLSHGSCSDRSDQNDVQIVTRVSYYYDWIVSNAK